MHRIWIRKLHRWVALVVVIQLLAWTAGGLYFSLIPIEEIRGEHLVRAPDTLEPAHLASALSPAVVLDQLDGRSISKLELTVHQGRAVYRAVLRDGPVLIDAASGAWLPAVDGEIAARIAAAALLDDAPVVAVTRLESVPRGHEYRGKPLPVYQVDFDHPSGIRLYVDATTGEVVTRRTDRWRIFDFLWMLHVMDYQDRDDFNHPLLTFAASVALLALRLPWWNSTPLRRRARRRFRQAVSS